MARPPPRSSAPFPRASSPVKPAPDTSRAASASPPVASWTVTRTHSSPSTQLRGLFAPCSTSHASSSYCKGGIAASADALALTLLGHRNVAIYDNSLNEWAREGELVSIAG